MTEIIGNTKTFLPASSCGLSAGSRSNTRNVCHVSLDSADKPQNDGEGVEWLHTPGLVDYEAAVTSMEERVADIRLGHAPEAIWLLEHPPIYTAGTSADPSDLIAGNRFPVYKTGRGGQYTYHGPGQRIVYVMLDLKKRQAQDLRLFIQNLEEWGIRTLQDFGVTAERRDGRVGLWVSHGRQEAKIAALGVRVRKWVTYHGMSINVAPNLDHFSGIVPCGLNNFGVASLESMGIKAGLNDLDNALKNNFNNIF